MSKKTTGFFCAVALSFSTLAFAQTDTALTASVKTKLAADDTVKASQVNVSTADHVVTLTGVVGSQAAKERALAIARETTGVTTVVDKLTVRETAAKTNAEKAAGGVEKGADKSAAAVGTAAHKSADAVDKSKGAVGTAAEKTGDAVGTAAKETGKAVGTAAKKTADAVGAGADKTKDATAKAGEKTKDATEKAGDKTKEKSETAGEKTKDKVSGSADKAAATMSDAEITAAVKTKLVGDGSTPGLKVDVDTRDGVVTLSGDVASAAEKTRAATLARGTKGVKSVVNKLTVEGK